MALKRGIDKAVEAMQKGAYSYILKPFDNERLVIYVNKAISMFRVVKENRQLRDAVKSHYSFGYRTELKIRKIG